MLSSLWPQVHGIGLCVLCVVYKSASCSWRNHMNNSVVLKCLSLAVFNTKNGDERDVHQWHTNEYNTVVETWCDCENNTHWIKSQSTWTVRTHAEPDAQRDQWHTNAHKTLVETWCDCDRITHIGWIVKVHESCGHAEPDARHILLRLRPSSMYTN